MFCYSFLLSLIFKFSIQITVKGWGTGLVTTLNYLFEDLSRSKYLYCYHFLIIIVIDEDKLLPLRNIISPKKKKKGTSFLSIPKVLFLGLAPPIIILCFGLNHSFLRIEGWSITG